MSETPNLRWFDEYSKCRCGKPSAGILRGVGNASYGDHCKACAAKRLKASQRERDKAEEKSDG